MLNIADVILAKYTYGPILLTEFFFYKNYKPAELFHYHQSHACLAPKLGPVTQEYMAVIYSHLTLHSGQSTSHDYRWGHLNWSE